MLRTVRAPGGVPPWSARGPSAESLEQRCWWMQEHAWICETGIAWTWNLYMVANRATVAGPASCTGPALVRPGDGRAPGRPQLPVCGGQVKTGRRQCPYGRHRVWPLATGTESPRLAHGGLDPPLTPLAPQRGPARVPCAVRVRSRGRSPTVPPRGKRERRLLLHDLSPACVCETSEACGPRPHGNVGRSPTRRVELLAPRQCVRRVEHPASPLCYQRERKREEQCSSTQRAMPMRNSTEPPGQKPKPQRGRTEQAKREPDTNTAKRTSQAVRPTAGQRDHHGLRAASPLGHACSRRPVWRNVHYLHVRTGAEISWERRPVSAERPVCELPDETAQSAGRPDGREGA